MQTDTFDSYDVPFGRGDAQLCGWELVSCREQQMDLWYVQRSRTPLDDFLIKQGVVNGTTVVVVWQ